MKKTPHIKIFSLQVIYVLVLLDVGLLMGLMYIDYSPLWVKISLTTLSAILMWLLWRGVIKPRRMVQIGMELLSSQDANNRLAPVGQPEADRIAHLFNTLMKRLREERLRLREQNMFLDKLIEASPMGVVILDFDFNIAHVNPAFLKLTGISQSSDILGKSLKSIPGNIGMTLYGMHEDDIKTIRCEDHRILRCFRLYLMELGFKRPFILLESLTEEVMQAERSAYGKVIRLMAHEVNNSMTGINTLLDILQTYHKDEPDISEFIVSVSERCRIMGRFIAGYADVVRLPEPDLKKLELGEFISSQLPFLRSNSVYPVEIDFCDNQAEIVADPDMLSQILVNIVKNSTEAITEKGTSEGRISISVKKISGSKVRLTISDNGCGISNETALNLFNPFYSTKPEGQGIGLTMIGEILHRHNAAFSLRTYEDGITRFNITFSSN